MKDIGMEAKKTKKPDWFSRLEAEHTEVCDKIWRIKDFLDSHKEPTKTFSCGAMMLLKEQLDVMCKLRDVLFLRWSFARAEAAMRKEGWIKEP